MNMLGQLSGLLEPVFLVNMRGQMEELLREDRDLYIRTE